MSESPVKDERAVESHIHLVNLVSERLRQAGSTPRYNAYVDLAARVGNVDFIFEMKSMTLQNTRSQLRKGLSQLYEYRYLQALPEAKLVLVLEMALPKPLRWVQDYLEQDRGILLVWDGDQQLYTSDNTKQELPLW